jgi:hypothetical protein
MTQNTDDLESNLPRIPETVPQQIRRYHLPLLRRSILDALSLEKRFRGLAAFKGGVKLFLTLQIYIVKSLLVHLSEIIEPFYWLQGLSWLSRNLSTQHGTNCVVERIGVFFLNLWFRNERIKCQMGVPASISPGSSAV